MEIESIVANSALVRAREDGGIKGRSWRWKEMLRFPHISHCANLEASIERDYRSLCTKQPIGKKLFQLFCRSRPDLRNCSALLEALEIFETTSDQERRDFGLSIVRRFLVQQSKMCVPCAVQHEAGCTSGLELDPCQDVFRDCREDLHKFLSGEPFKQYQDSMYFDRFLQWKMLERQPVTKHAFRQYRLLGKGGFGEVWACQVRATGMMYACKKLDKTHVKKRKGEAMALNEKQILEGLDSRFVVNLAYAYETKHSLCMVLTMMSGGDLRFHIYKMGEPGLERERVKFYAAQVCCGLMHLHQESILYRDLKPENILLDDYGHIRISDLGLAVRLTAESEARGRVGTLGYMAPEVVSHKFYGLAVDWWGLGCLIYEMIAGRTPFRGRGERPKTSEMERRIRREVEDYGESFATDVKDLCSRLLSKNPNKRLGCQSSGGREVQAHPFFKDINFRRLEAGLIEPPFKPDPRLVYCNDIGDLEEFSAVRGVTLDQIDDNFYSKFNTGSVTITWQNELIETGCFKELNVFGPGGTRTPDLDDTQPPESSKRSLLRRIFHRHQHATGPPDESREGLVSTGTYMSNTL